MRPINDWSIGVLCWWTSGLNLGLGVCYAETEASRRQRNERKATQLPGQVDFGGSLFEQRGFFCHPASSLYSI